MPRTVEPARPGFDPLPSWAGFVRSTWFLRIVLPLLGVVVVYKLLVLFCIAYVAPNEFGIKVVRVPILGKRGVHEEVYDTGYHLVLRVLDLEEMYLFPKDTRSST